MATSLRVARLTPQASRVVAIALALLVILAVVSVIAVPAWVLHRQYDDDIERLERSYRAYQRAFQTRAATLEKLEAVTAKDASRFYLKAANLSLATAEVQDKVSAIFNANGGRILTTQVPPPKDEGRFKQVIVNFQGYANAPTLRKMLFALESAEPKVFVENFTVRSQLPFNYRGQPGVEPEMYVTFDAMAYLLQEPRDATPKPDGKAPKDLKQPDKGASAKSGDSKGEVRPTETKADPKTETKSAINTDAKVEPKVVKSDARPDAKLPVKADPAKSEAKK